MKSLFFTLSLFFAINTLAAQNGRFVETNGVSIYYEELGSGEPLLLLHGFTMTHEVWKPYIEDLGEHYRLIIPDLRGHGRSTNPSNTFTHKFSGEDMYGLMDALEIENFKAIGHSSGAMTLTHMATKDTTRIASMVLIGSTTYFPEACRVIQRSVNMESMDENWFNYMKHLHPGGEDQIRKLLGQFRGMAEYYDDMNFTTPYLSTITAETLIIHGDRDEFFSVDIPAQSYKAIQNSYLWIIPNFGHSMPSPEGALGTLFMENIIMFLDGQWK
ncbi:alpha/beta fold hydrolase [Aegicerativicinus sediminis]